MATFQPNPNTETEPWIEHAAFENFGFRIWHVVLIAVAAFATCVILICCCVKLRVPRTKQEIEADHRRKRLVSKFRDRLKLIRNNEMDALDLRKALELIREDYDSETRRLDEYNYNCDVTQNLRAEPQQHG